MSRCLSEGKCQQRGVRVPIFIDANADVLKAVLVEEALCVLMTPTRELLGFLYLYYSILL